MTVYSWTQFLVVLEMLVAVLIFIYPYEKRSHFWLRYLISAVLCLAVSFFYNGIVYLITGSADLEKGGRVLQCLIFFALTIGVYLVSFRLKFRVTISLCCSGYALQHLIYQISNIFHSLPLGDGFTAFVTTWHRYVELAIFVVLYALFILIFGKKVAGSHLDKNFNNALNFLVIFVVLVCIVLSLYAGKSDIVIFVSSYAIICCALALVLQFAVSGITRLNRENESIRRRAEQDIVRYESVKEAVDFINIKCHDLKKELNLLKDKVNIEQLEELKNTIEIYDNVPHTGNAIIDTVIINATLTQAHKGVTFTFSGNGEWLDFVDELDLKALFMNIVTNALEAASQVDDGKRNVSVMLEKKGEMVFITVRNYYAGQLVVQGKFPATTKTVNADEHGFGLKSMQAVAKKYGGNVTASGNGEIFTLCVYLEDMTNTGR